MVEDTVVQHLFDVSGRRMPPAGIGAPVNDASDRYGLAQPAVAYGDIHARLTEHIPTTSTVSAMEFEERAEGLVDSLRRNEDTRDLTNGVRLPFILATGGNDLGKVLDDVYLPAVASSWKVRFPKYTFKNELNGRLAGKVALTEGSRYERLVQALAQGPLVGYYFPLALSGFSADAGRKQMADLPDSFSLSGGYEACAALVGCPDLFVKNDGYPPQLDLTALRGPVTTYGYHFAPYGHNLTFNGRHHNGLASDYCSPGLTVIAPSRKKS